MAKLFKDELLKEFSFTEKKEKTNFHVKPVAQWSLVRLIYNRILLLNK